MTWIIDREDLKFESYFMYVCTYGGSEHIITGSQTSQLPTMYYSNQRERASRTMVNVSDFFCIFY